MAATIIPIPVGDPAFLGGERCDDLDTLDADIAIVGVPYGVPYDMAGSTSPSSPSPRAIREQSVRFGRFLTHYDVDFGGDLFAGRSVRIVDCGDVAMQPGQYETNAAVTTAVIRRVLERGAVPIVLGGDHSIPIPVMRAFEGTGDLCVVQIDAHLDWRDEINGVHQGLSSPMRRASELPFVRSMAQFGVRGVGSGRQREFDDARAFGSVIIEAADIHRNGIEVALENLPVAERYYITFDMDGLDPSIAPGVNAHSFGGLTYFQAFDLLRGVAAKGAVAGFDIVEIAPARDVHNLTSMLAARLILNLIGAMAHSAQIGRP